MRFFINGLRLITGLLLVAGLSVAVWAASGLPRNFPVHVIPIPNDAAVTDQSDFDHDLDVMVDKKNITGPAMVKFYHEGLNKTIPHLNEYPGKDGGQTYWFWGEFDNGKACFSLAVVGAKNPYPEFGAGAQIRVLLKKKNELPEYWKQSKDMLFKYVRSAVQ